MGLYSNVFLSPNKILYGDILSPNKILDGDILSPNKIYQGDILSPNRGRLQVNPIVKDCELKVFTL